MKPVDEKISMIDGLRELTAKVVKSNLFNHFYRRIWRSPNAWTSLAVKLVVVLTREGNKDPQCRHLNC